MRKELIVMISLQNHHDYNLTQMHFELSLKLPIELIKNHQNYKSLANYIRF
jgi:hypothetical protein